MEYTVKLQRDSLESPWGFRLQGGADLSSQLTIQRVFSGTPAEGELQRGDILLVIDNREASNLTHSAAEQLIKSSGGELTLRVKRTGPNQSLPHTQFDSSKDKNMYRQPGGPTYQPAYGVGHYSNVPQGSKLTPQDQAMLKLVSNSLANKSMYPSNVVSPATRDFYDEPNNQQHYGWVPAQMPANAYYNQPPKKTYQPQNFNRPNPGPLSYKPAKNPFSATAHAAHLQYNSPLSLYSAKNAQNALSASVPGDSAAGQTIKQQINSRAAARAQKQQSYQPVKSDNPRLSSYHGGEAKGDIIDSPTLRYVLREDEVKAKTGHKPGVKFYKEVREYGPGKVPLKAYKEDVDDSMPTSDF